jgi:chorismate-pyruvate lyase
MVKAICGCAILLLGSSAGAEDLTAPRTADWTASFLARVEALALLQTLNGELLSNDSATSTLEHWCEVHRLAAPPRIVAERVTGVDKAPSPEQRRELGVTATEPLRYRRVRLLCGAVVLSEADNWYVPARLTPEMNRLLDTTDEPFGRVVQALQFKRRTLSSTALWHPLPEGWEMSSSGPEAGAPVSPMPPKLLEHRAILSLPDGTPISEVVESYTSNVLAFPVPPPR